MADDKGVEMETVLTKATFDSLDTVSQEHPQNGTKSEHISGSLDRDNIGALEVKPRSSC
jgi:hypothetical protein